MVSIRGVNWFIFSGLDTLKHPIKENVILNRVKDLKTLCSQILRFAQNDKIPCHPDDRREEGSRKHQLFATEIFRYAQQHVFASL